MDVARNAVRSAASGSYNPEGGGGAGVTAMMKLAPEVDVQAIKVLHAVSWLATRSSACCRTGCARPSPVLPIPTRHFARNFSRMCRAEHGCESHVESQGDVKRGCDCVAIKFMGPPWPACRRSIRARGARSGQRIPLQSGLSQGAAGGGQWHGQDIREATVRVRGPGRKGQGFAGQRRHAPHGVPGKDQQRQSPERQPAGHVEGSADLARSAEQDRGRARGSGAGEGGWRGERKGEFLGSTVQVIPHITDEIKKRISK